MNIVKYPHTEIEAKWQKRWLDAGVYTLDLEHAKKPYYNLMMFPYPSAEGLHVGNMYAFTGTDIFGRYMRMLGYDVFEPIGLDGFGIHSENYALKVGRHPMDQAKISQENYYRQLRAIGCMYDWSRALETYDPSYYRWTQWLFVQMFRNGLAYRSKAQVNWCPSCKTVLADEQVLPAPSGGGDEKCERCGNIVDNRLLEQWFFRITAYAGKLLENISSLPVQAGLKWTEKVLIAQRNWIGQKEGINISYPVVDEKKKKIADVTCFTTRPDTNYGATFVVLAPEHPLINDILGVIKKEQAVRITQYVKNALKISKQDRNALKRKKTGVFTGLYCVNHLTGYLMPLYISDFVVMEVGTGAVVGVPGHDLRDFEFARIFEIPVIRVVKGRDGEVSDIIKSEQVQENEGTMMNSLAFNGLDIHEATTKMMDYFEEKNWGKRVTTYHLRDWLVSRQRYWGPPIPMIHCDRCEKAGKGERPDIAGWYTVSEKELPLILPRIEDYKPGDDGIAPLAKHKEFYETICPGCGEKAHRETDVSDTFLDSSWYFLRYPSIGSKTESVKAFDPEITKKWLPVTMYTGGAEHSVLHLMYSRFITMALKDWGYLSGEEPFPNFYAHGLVVKDGAKMSKSKGNVVNPDEYIKLYGSDALRLYLMFMGPFSEGGDFSDSAMEGMSRWLNRVWRILTVSLESGKECVDTAETTRALHKLVKKVSKDTATRHYNTAISAMMEFTNKTGTLSCQALRTFLLVLAPFAPHITEELWSRCNEAKKISNLQGKSVEKWSIHQQSYPTYDEKETFDDTVTIIVQVNGKLRDSIVVDRVSAGNKEKIEAIVRDLEKVQKYLQGVRVKKVIFVSEKLINFVV